jgi:phage terminase large subunit GpA-like protein
MSRLALRSKGAGYVHLPHWTDDEYIAQLTSERAVRKYVKGRGSVREWQQMRERNEALDLMVYAFAALYLCGPSFLKSLGERALSVSLKPETKPEDAQVAKATAQSKLRRGWMKGF